MRYARLQALFPRTVRRYLLAFEAAIEDAVQSFAASLPEGARVLDAGAGESRHSADFPRQRYYGVDLAVGDATWDYGSLAALADLTHLPFRDHSFSAAINIVTLEHVREPKTVLRELHRTLAPGGRLLLIVPHEWEVHQHPHDFFRYTCFGVRYLLEEAGFTAIAITPVGGYFRLLSRRLLNGLQFFPGLWKLPAALFLIPPAVVLPLFDSLDRPRDFTLGYVCTARRPDDASH